MIFLDCAVVVRCECNVQMCVCNLRGTMTPSVLGIPSCGQPTRGKETKYFSVHSTQSFHLR
jgi:hypothetical protein